MKEKPSDTTNTTAEPDASANKTIALSKSTAHRSRPADKSTNKPTSTLPPEVGGQAGPEPTRYGDWEKNGRCTDF